MANKFKLPTPTEFNKNKPLFMLDAGHGGLIDGVYQTSGKRSPAWAKGVYHEGVGNRDFVDRIARLSVAAGLQVLILTPEDADIPLHSASKPTLDTRVKRANDVHKMYPNAVLISVHSNAGGGRGWEVFTSKGQTKSDAFAELFVKQTNRLWPLMAMRKDMTDGDGDKEENFAVLKYTSCPSVLTENLFMDNVLDYEELFKEGSRDVLAMIHFNAMKEHHNQF